MKHIQTFESFVNEGKKKAVSLNEKKILSPATIKQFNLSKDAATLLKNWKFKFKDIEFKFKDFKYWGNEPLILSFLNGVRTFYLDNLSVEVGDTEWLVHISWGKNKLGFDSEKTEERILHFNIDKQTFDTYIGNEDDKLMGFVNLLNFVFKKFESELYEIVKSKLNLQTLYVINAGKISPSTGKTDHGWSIYDYPDGMLGITKWNMVLWSANGFKVGDKFKILDDQTHKVISNEVEITELVPATYKDFVALSRRKGAVVPVAAFKKQTGKFSYELYSIK